MDASTRGVSKLRIRLLVCMAATCLVAAGQIACAPSAVAASSVASHAHLQARSVKTLPAKKGAVRHAVRSARAARLRRRHALVHCLRAADAKRRDTGSANARRRAERTDPVNARRSKTDRATHSPRGSRRGAIRGERRHSRDRSGAGHARAAECPRKRLALHAARTRLRRLKARLHSARIAMRTRTRRLAAPELKASRQNLNWNQVDSATRYVLETAPQDGKPNYTVLEGTSTTPDAPSDGKVQFRVRADVKNSEWSNAVALSYDAGTSPSTPSSQDAPSALSTGVGTVQAPQLSITATTYYVSLTGSDSNSGTDPAAAWRTVERVNEADLRPGDGVLFEGGATFAGETLMPPASGAPGEPIVFGSYGDGDAILPKGVWFKGDNHLAFSHLTIGPEGDIQGTGEDITIEWCTIGQDDLAINATGGNSAWVIDDNAINHTGNSGMLLEGDNFTVSGNTITNTGLDSSIPYGKHGIYLKVSNAAVTYNTITDFSADGVSARYRNSVIADNNISGGAIGIGWFQYDPIAGTSRWTGNSISETTTADIYVSPSDVGGQTRETFVIADNSLEHTEGVYLSLSPTLGTYTNAENAFTE